MTVRHATPADAETIAVIAVRAWQVAYSGLMPASYLDALDTRTSAARWRETLLHPGPRGVFVSQDKDNGLTGFCLCGPSRDKDVESAAVAELIALNIHPEHWRRGHGQALCQAAVQDAHARGFRRLTLWTLHANSAARSFYERLGFSADGAEKRDSERTGFALHQLRYARDLCR